jgi:prolyl-tRNA synthetase
LIQAEADTGNMGGTRSHEYQLLSPNGEDTVLVCTGCKYSANVEKAVGKIALASTNNPKLKMDHHSEHPGLLELIQELESKLKANADGKVFLGPKTPVLLIVPGNRTVNETKLLKNANLECLIGKTIESDSRPIHVVVDSQVSIKNHNFQIADIINIETGDSCSICDSTLNTHRAIEVAHTFFLGTKYSAVLNETFKSSSQQLIPFQMGCYGIGVSRLIAAVVDARNDSNGMIWPKLIAPYQICVIHISKDHTGELQSQFMEQLYHRVSDLFDSRDIILDDRDVSFGFKMKDALLVGYPYVMVVGKSYYESGQIEIHDRSKGKQFALLDDLHTLFQRKK